MKRAALVLIATFAVAGAALAQEAVFVVRHAERADQSADSPLSDAGRARAERLATVLRDARITKIYTTDLRRTIDTAAPIATQLHLDAAALPAGDRTAVLDCIKAAAPTDRLLIVGHSNTVPAILAALGVAEPVTITDEEYDNLFLVVPRAGRQPLFFRLRF